MWGGMVSCNERGIFKHAFVIPFGMMEMMMLANAEKEPRFKVRVGQAGGKNIDGKYATLHIIEGCADALIASQKNEHEKDATLQLNEVYSARIVQPNIAYLKQNTFWR